MNIERFAELARSLVVSPSRRSVSRLLLRLSAGSLLAPLFEIGESEAKKKRKHKRKHKKKKKACQSGTKPCGTSCIAATACCLSSECGEGGACVDGTCQCLSGLKPCDGTCIPNDQCCGGCPEGKGCDSGSGTCICDPPNFECPDGRCVFGCCDDAECPETQECIDGNCFCPGADDIACGAECCDIAADEICRAEGSSSSCQDGGCPETNLCSATIYYFCSIDLACLCTTTVDVPATNACIDPANSPNCHPCGTSMDCDPGQVCIADGEFCNCGGSFCAALCDTGAPRKAKHGLRGAAIAMTSARRQGSKRHP